MDEFELHARKWAAYERTLAAARVMEKRHNLYPQLVHDLEDAIREDDKAAYEIALARVLEAVVDA